MRKARVGVLSTIMSLALCGVGCGPGWEPGTTATSDELVSSVCTAYQPVRSLDVGYSTGACLRYTVPYTQNTAVIYQVPPPPGNLGNVVSVRTGLMTAAWICDTATPRGFAESPDSPCWSGATRVGVVARVRGPYVGGYYQGASAVIGAGGVGRSLVVSEGNLPGPPWCTYALTITTADDPLHYHTCNLDPDAQVAGEVKANSAPDDSDQCCNVSTTWPPTNGVPGDSGRPCTTNVAPNVGYAVVYYPPCPAH